jgi:hypothetical protein
MSPMNSPKRKRPHKPLLFTRGSPARRWASIAVTPTPVSIELITPFLRLMESLLPDDSIGEIMGSPNASWWYEREGIMPEKRPFHSTSANSAPASKLRTTPVRSLTKTILSYTSTSQTEGSLQRSIRRSCALHFPHRKEVHQPPLHRR